MKKILRLMVIFGCLAWVNAVFATDSFLTITNNAVGFNAEITTDLLCGKQMGQGIQGFNQFSARYTTPLDENPIKPDESKTASWKNCTIAADYLFAPDDLHNKIYVRLTDEQAGVYLVATLPVGLEQTTENIDFENRNFVISMNHEGDYVWGWTLIGIKTIWVNSTRTTITING